MEVGKVGDNKQSVFTLSVAYVLITLIIAYFYFFPTLINPLFSDILIVMGVLLLLCCLTYASIKAKSSREVILVLLAIMLVSILARLIPHLRLAYPPLHDPYFYFISFLNILEHGTLQPILSWWYPLLDMHLQWPVMHLLGAMTAQVTGIDSMWFLRFQAPLLGAVFSLAVFALAKEATKNNTIALLSALFASASDVVIFYQAQYHPQGFALIFFVLFLYIYLKSRTTGRLSYRVGALMCIAVLVLSHHFSSLFVALLAISFIGLNHLIPILPRRIGWITQVAREVRADYNLWIILAGTGLAYHFLTVAISPVGGFLSALVEEQPPAMLLAVGADVPMLTTLLNSAKWGILLLATFSIIKAVRSPQPHQFRLLVLLAPILFSGFIGNYLTGGPIDRFILFYVPIVSVFAAMTIQKLFIDRLHIRGTQLAKVIMVPIIGALLAAGFFNAQTPAYYFKSGEVNTYYRYSDDLSSIDKYGYTGQWIKEFTPENSRYVTEEDTIVIPFFYGERPIDNIQHYLYYAYMEGRVRDRYIVVNPTIPYSFDGKYFDKEHFLNSIDILYTNGVVIIGWSE